ncbi:MAG TPA: class I SAM-dependent methyltransferase [Syntrophomonadaceae bacterium]|nr:class I SAM-dependent methyltransferase [Syntrophomonadaceae bacterium]
MKNEKRDFNTEAANWDENPGRIKMASDIARSISEAITMTSNMNVMDFGCGTGLLTLQLQPLVGSIIGVDSSPGMLQVLSKKIESQNLANVSTHHLDVEQGQNLKGFYDLVVSSMTLHHIQEIQPLIRQFYDVLLPNGYLCIADLDSDDGKFHESNEGVFHFGFDRDMMCRFFEEAGFEGIEVGTAAEILKPVAGEGGRLFTVFLIRGRKMP